MTIITFFKKSGYIFAGHMHRHFIGHILFFTLLLQTFSGYLLKADYVLNQRLYEERCENKERPQLKCKGKCQLSKKMLEAEKEEQKQQGKSGNKAGADEVIAFVSFLRFRFFNVYASSEYAVLRNVHFLSTGFGNAVFQPPRFS